MLQSFYPSFKKKKKKKSAHSVARLTVGCHFHMMCACSERCAAYNRNWSATPLEVDLQCMKHKIDRTPTLCAWAVCFLSYQDTS